MNFLLRYKVKACEASKLVRELFLYCKKKTPKSSDELVFPQATTSGNMQDSICPKGWGLPINGDLQTTKSWINLLFTNYSLQDNGDSSTSAHKTPLSLVYSGYYSWINGGLFYRGSDGYFWASTPGSAAGAHSLNFISTRLIPQGGGDKLRGFSIRCVV